MNSIESTKQKSNSSTELVASNSKSKVQLSNDSTMIQSAKISTGSNVVIHIENLWKQYRLGTINYGTLVSDLQSWWARMRGKEDPNLRLDQSLQQVNGLTSDSDSTAAPDRFWALKDISFDVRQGEIVGIIGKNGAGKSTLLKILSRVTTPTQGQINIKGRVASLLEVGTGFHPELTGRENVFLNGAILGMDKQEIRSKFDEIVVFSGVEKFIDTPVKRYSSGMYVRLAFAVAAHLDPEILIVDEVLSVGDLAFQKKCLGKMGDIASEGRTVLFVSHNMETIRALCERGIVFLEGKVVADAPILDAVLIYNEQIRQLEFGAETEIHNPTNRRGSGAVRFTKIKIQDAEGKESQVYRTGETIRFALDFKVFEPVDNLYGAVVLRCGKTREIVTGVRHLLTKGKLSAGHEDQFIVEFPDINLRPRDFLLYFWLGGEREGRFHPYDTVDDILPPLIITLDKNALPQGFLPSEEIPGYFTIPSKLTIK